MIQNTPSENLTFRPFVADDIPLLHKWLNMSHVSRWFSMEPGNKNPTLEQVYEKWMRRIEKQERVQYYIVLLDMIPIAYIQWYLVSDFTDSMALVPDSENMAGIDVFIGKADCLYRGPGPAFINKFLKEVVFAIPEIQSCMIDPEQENTAAIRAYEKVGFKHSHTTWDGKYGVYAYVMFLNKGDLSGTL